jgi:putative ABC transport system permease protein
VIRLSAIDLGLAASLVLVLAGLSLQVHRDLSRQIVIAALRTTVQLLLVGLILKVLFQNADFPWILLMALIMVLAAGREVVSRQERRFAGWWGFGVGTVSMFLSSFSVTLFALHAIIQTTPWYEPQYAIPMLGMLLGNTMNGIAIAMDRLTQGVWLRRREIEAQIILGHSAVAAMRRQRYDAVRSGMIPIINAMATAGIVSLPGMMTGQILAGAPPVEAVKYQILIMFLIAVGTGLGTLAAVWAASSRLFDGRQRLRLDRLSTPNPR